MTKLKIATAAGARFIRKCFASEAVGDSDGHLVTSVIDGCGLSALPKDGTSLRKLESLTALVSSQKDYAKTTENHEIGPDHDFESVGTGRR